MECPNSWRAIVRSFQLDIGEDFLNILITLSYESTIPEGSLSIALLPAGSIVTLYLVSQQVSVIVKQPYLLTLIGYP